MHRVLLNFQLRGEWWAHFIEEDCKTEIGVRTRYFKFDTLEELRAFVIRCNADQAAMDDFENAVRCWARGSVFVTLTDEQYGKLKG